MDDHLTLAQDIEARLKDFEQKADLYAARERIFGLPPSEYPTLTGKNQAAYADERKIKVHAARKRSPACPHETDSICVNMSLLGSKAEHMQEGEAEVATPDTGRQFEATHAAAQCSPAVWQPQPADWRVWHSNWGVCIRLACQHLRKNSVARASSSFGMKEKSSACVRHVGR